MYELYSLPSDWQRVPADDCEQLLLVLGHSEELFPKLRTPTGLMVQVQLQRVVLHLEVQVKNKTQIQNWAIH